MGFSPISAGPFAITSVANAVTPPGTAVYTGTITGGSSNAFANYTFTITGFTLSNGSNNGTYFCVASTINTITLVNPNAVSETGVAAANGAQILLQTGPFASNSTFENPNLGGQPPVTGLIVPQDSPKSASLVPRNYVNGFNYINTITSTEEYLQNTLHVEGAQQGSNVVSATISFNTLSASQFQAYKFQ